MVWCTGDKVDAVAVAVLRRAVSLRAVNVSHASALAAIEAGPVADVGDGGLCMCAPLANLQTMTLNAVATDAASLCKTLDASPHVSTVSLRWSDLSQPWDLLHAAASATSTEAVTGRRRVRRVRLVDVNLYAIAFDPDQPARSVLALFPRARHASWNRNELLLPQTER
jgi:hypothetical protein